MSPPLSSILQTPAARTRALSSALHFHLDPPPPLGLRSSSNTSAKFAANPAKNTPRPSAPLGARPIKLNSSSFSPPRDPARLADVLSSPPTDTGTPVAVPTEPLPTSSIPLPTSLQSLYRNLLVIVSNPQFPIRRAIDYYFRWPKAWHSTKSFNLLISLALRHASFASVRYLLGAMRTEYIPANMETWKLHVRWLVRIGRWNDAWNLVLQVSEEQSATSKLPPNTIPLPLWLELFGSQKRGALRHWVSTDCRPNKKPGSQIGCSARPNTGLEDAEHPTLLFRKSLMPRPSQRPHAVEMSRYRILMRHSPLLTSSDQVQILPRTILIITQKMHQVGQTNLALSTALSYVKSLGPQLRRCDRRKVLDLVNFHLSAVTRQGKPGLKQHFSQRRVLWKFLDARPGLIPSSTTLFLLLGPLRSCRRSGTLAMQCLRLFERRWGPRVQSRSVRRRVASLALKEGRLDIVNIMMGLERRCRVYNHTFPRVACSSMRKPWRTLFSRRGAENQRWRSVEDKYRQRLESRSETQAAVDS